MTEHCGCICDDRTGDMLAECDFHLAIRTNRDALRARVAELEVDRNNIQWALSAQLDAYKVDLAAARAIAAEYRSALRVVFFPDHNEREWQSLAECQEWARLECVRIDAALAKEKA